MVAEGRTSVKLVKEQSARRNKARTKRRRDPHKGGSLPWLEGEFAIDSRVLFSATDSLTGNFLDLLERIYLGDDEKR